MREGITFFFQKKKKKKVQVWGENVSISVNPRVPSGIEFSHYAIFQFSKLENINGDGLQGTVEGVTPLDFVLLCKSKSSASSSSHFGGLHARNQRIYISKRDGKSFLAFNLNR